MEGQYFINAAPQKVIGALADTIYRAISQL